MADPDLGIVDALAQLTFLIQGKLAQHAGEHELSMVQTRLLGILRDREPTMQELARQLELDKSSVTGLVDRAEKRSLVKRIPVADDRRAVRVGLTPSGRRLVSRVETVFAAEVEAAVAGLSAPDRERLSKLASRVVAANARAE